MISRDKTKREQIVENVKACGQSLIDNAEEIVGNYKFLCGIGISCYVDDLSEPARINVNHDFYPEPVIEQYKEGDDYDQQILR